LDRAERLLDLVGDLGLGEPRVIGELDDLALGVGQSAQGAPDGGAVRRALGRLAPRGGRGGGPSPAARPGGAAGPAPIASSGGATTVSLRRRVARARSIARVRARVIIHASGLP